MKRNNDFSGGLYILLVILVAVIILFAVAQPAGAVRKPDRYGPRELGTCGARFSAFLLERGTVRSGKLPGRSPERKRMQRTPGPPGGDPRRGSKIAGPGRGAPGESQSRLAAGKDRHHARKGLGVGTIRPHPAGVRSPRAGAKGLEGHFLKGGARGCIGMSVLTWISIVTWITRPSLRPPIPHLPGTGRRRGGK